MIRAVPKGLFTNSIVAFFATPPSLDALVDALGGFEIEARRDDSSDNPWLGGAGLILKMRPEVHGLATVDVVGDAWPDRMGDPEREANLFMAWSFGAFGPFVFPGSLERARRHALSWADAEERVVEHRAFVRVRSSYVLGQGADAAVLPPDYDPVVELHYLTRVARALLEVEGALGYFAPSGEVLKDAAGVDKSLSHHASHELPPFDLWVNVRFFQVGDDSSWGVMDTVGMEQLDVIDQEACFPIDRVDPDEVAPFLRGLCFYLLENGDVVETGHTVEGPGGVWQARRATDSLVPAPRETIRWMPTFVGDAVPEALR
jgi:hypothetical protein